MIGVSGVVFGTEHGAERAARGIVGCVEKRPLARACAPVVPDVHPATVRKDEPGDVDRIAGCVLAPSTFRTAVDPAAGMRAIVLDCRHPAAENSRGRGLNPVAQPQHKRDIDRTGRVGRGRVEPHVAQGIGRKDCPVRPPALALTHGWSDRKRNPAALQDCPAFEWIVAERGKFAAGCPAGRVVQIKRSPRIVLGMIAQPRP